MRQSTLYLVAGWFGMGLAFSRWYFVGIVIAGLVLIVLEARASR